MDELWGVVILRELRRTPLDEVVDQTGEANK